MSNRSLLNGTFALGLLLGARGASAAPALTPSAPAALTQPGHTFSTPTATVSSKVPPSHSEEDIRDIRQPRHLPSSWSGAAVTAGVIIFSAGLFAAWRWLRRGKFLEMQPNEIALQQLEEARRLMDPEQAREYCFAVSTIIRGYIEQQFESSAPRLTTEEFLRVLVEGQDTMLAAHRALLSEFLVHCDMAKFAGWRYSQPALEDMQASAVDFVVLTSAQPSPATADGSPASNRGTSAPSATVIATDQTLVRAS